MRASVSQQVAKSLVYALQARQTFRKEGLARQAQAQLETWLPPSIDADTYSKRPGYHRCPQCMQICLPEQPALCHLAITEMMQRNQHEAAASFIAARASRFAFAVPIIMPVIVQACPCAPVAMHAIFLGTALERKRGLHDQGLRAMRHRVDCERCLQCSHFRLRCVSNCYGASLGMTSLRCCACVHARIPIGHGLTMDDCHLVVD